MTHPEIDDLSERFLRHHLPHLDDMHRRYVEGGQPEGHGEPDGSEGFDDQGPDDGGVDRSGDQLRMQDDGALTDRDDDYEDRNFVDHSYDDYDHDRDAGDR
jgi:hypothetical protein